MCNRIWLARGLALPIVLSFLMFAGLATADNRGPDIEKVLGGIDLDVGNIAGNLQTVNGGISMDDDSVARKIRTVNGGVRLGDNVSVMSVKVVNGGVRAGRNLTVTGGVDVVNGGVKAGAGSQIEEDVITVNGDIRLRETRIGKNIETVNGNVDVMDGSVVEGDVVFRKRRGHYFHGWERPTLTIDKTSAVKGDIFLHQKVKLDIHEDAKIGKVIEDFDEEDWDD